MNAIVDPPELVLFDLGNVVVAWDPMPAFAASVGEDAGRAFLHSDTFDFHAWNVEQDRGRSFADAYAVLERDHPELVGSARAYREHFAASLTGPVPGTEQIVTELADAGVRVAALTNWSAETFPLARERFDVLGRFEDIVVSGEVGLVKPDRAIFDLACSRLGVAPGRVVFVDDSEANVAGARAAGLRAHHFVDAARLRADLAADGLPLAPHA